MSEIKTPQVRKYIVWCNEHDKPEKLETPDKKKALEFYNNHNKSTCYAMYDLFFKR